MNVSASGDNQELPPYVSLDVSSISLALLVLGLYTTVISQISYFLKERLYISSALISVAVGVAVGPYGANIISPLNWVGGEVLARNQISYEFMRLVIGIQVMFAGISLPAAYLKREWKSLAVLLLPIMTLAWIISSALIYALIPGLQFVEALCIAACITPTDPVLAASIVRGRYAEKHVARNVRDIISAESGANDGLGYPFVFLPILLMRQGKSPLSAVMGDWFVSIWIYDILLSCALGAFIGFIARKTLKEAHRRQLVDHESFLAYGVGLAFLVLGVVGVIGSDDLLAAFIAGNSLTWQDFYRVEAEDDTFQDVIDSLLNASVFIYIGTLIPWHAYSNINFQLSPWRLVLLSISILALKRLPWIVAMYRIIPTLHDRPQAIFAGWFGPIGVSAFYYALVCLKELPSDRTHLREVIVPVVLFIVFASTVAHGVSIPISKFGPRVFTRTKSTFSRTSTRTQEVFKAMRTKAVVIGDISAPIRPDGAPAVNDQRETGNGSAESGVVADIEAGMFQHNNLNIEQRGTEGVEGGDIRLRELSEEFDFSVGSYGTARSSMSTLGSIVSTKPLVAPVVPPFEENGESGQFGFQRFGNGIISLPGTRPGTPIGRVEFAIPE